jgi:hypothetical protein
LLLLLLLLLSHSTLTHFPIFTLSHSPSVHIYTHHLTSVATPRSSGRHSAAVYISSSHLYQSHSNGPHSNGSNGGGAGGPSTPRKGAPRRGGEMMRIVPRRGDAYVERRWDMRML